MVYHENTSIFSHIMVEPLLNLTASVIVNLAFQKFLESGAGELGKKFTTDAIATMDTLRKKLWQRLTGKSEINENSQTQNIYEGGTGFQSQAKDSATVNNAKVIHQYYGNPPNT